MRVDLRWYVRVPCELPEQRLRIYARLQGRRCEISGRVPVDQIGSFIQAQAGERIEFEVFRHRRGRAYVEVVTDLRGVRRHVIAEDEVVARGDVISERVARERLRARVVSVEFVG